MNLVNDCACVCWHEYEHAIRQGKFLGSNKEKWQKYTWGEEEAREQSNKTEKQKEVNWE